MGRTAGWGCAVVGGLALAWGVATSSDDPHVVVEAPHVAFTPVAVDGTGEARERAIYREIRRAQRLAMTTATGPALESGGTLVSPSSRKTDASRVALIGHLVAQTFDEMATAYDMTVGELKEIYLRGEAARWEVSDGDKR